MARTKSRTASSQQTVRMPRWAVGTRVICKKHGTFARVLAFSGGKVRLKWEKNGSTDWYTAEWLKEYRVEKASDQDSAAPDPRQIAGACVRVPSGVELRSAEGVRAFVEGIDPKDPGRVLISYEAGLGGDSYPLHMLKLVQESLEKATEPAKATAKGNLTNDLPFAVGDRVEVVQASSLTKSRLGSVGIVQQSGKLRTLVEFADGKATFKREWLKRVDAPIATVAVSATRRLEDLEQTIQQGIEQIKSSEAAIWEAVAEVQQRQLWKTGDYSSFEDYCKKRWGWEKSNSFEVAAAGRIVGELKESGVPESALPTSVAQTRQIAKLPAAKRAEVVQTIATKGEKLTAKAIKAAVEPKVFQRGDRVTIAADDDLNGEAAIVEGTETDRFGTVWVDLRCAELSGMALDYRAEDLKLVHPANADSLFELGQLLERADGASKESDFVADLQAEVAAIEAATVAEPPIHIPTKITPDQQVAEQLILQWDTSIVEVTKRLLSWCRKDELEKISKLLADEFRKKEAD